MLATGSCEDDELETIKSISRLKPLFGDLHASDDANLEILLMIQNF